MVGNLQPIGVDMEELRVRMGGWCAHLTMLSEAQQEHHIQRQENQF
jgi:pyruvate-formate lyase